jgi:hypothetical protein
MSEGCLGLRAMVKLRPTMTTTWILHALANQRRGDVRKTKAVANERPDDKLWGKVVMFAS